ncbi:chemotaxis protein CheA [Chachezhania sediminis]|uniref:chemotaxis protein CheA n=1 Tax=Chachezhania sediminis TaxID=2599291 RepID=UPI00131B129F|nr:chemotaxis protein CheA [Chachezhania sediminis]
MTDLRTAFFEECEELLESLADGLSRLEDGADDSETVNSIFRAVHSIKGSAGAFGLDALAEFSHIFENVLDKLREGELTADADLMPLLYQGGDHLSYLVEAANGGVEVEPDRAAALIADLRRTAQGDGFDEDEDASDLSAVDVAAVDSFQPIILDFGLPDLGSVTTQAAQAGPSRFEIRFAPKEELFETGHDPILLFRALGALGPVEAEADLSNLPEFTELDWDRPYLSWTLMLETEASRDAVEGVFEFVADLCELEITAVAREGTGDDPLPPSDDGTPPPDEDDGSDEPGGSDPEDDDSTAAAVEPAVRSEPEAAKPQKKAEAGTVQKANRDTIRVELERVDRLVNIVGELVISEAMLRQAMADSSMSAHGPAANAMGQLRQLSGELQESVMAIRAQPVRGLFQRMSRIVRETLRETKKNARLVSEGEATEVDKTVIERLVDPLTHMIRNAIDHGLESPEKREAAGKPAVGTVTLSAAHRSGRVIIELRDDGAGINRPKVREVAISKGLITAADDLSDAEIDNLLFAPGFSTSEKVSNLSGRGVGMDVVRSEIQALGGRVSISSEWGKGTVFSISLPLTLAVLEGMIVEVAGEKIVVPTTTLRETVRASEAAMHMLGNSERVLSMRDGLVPIVDLGESLGFRGRVSDFSDQSLLLIETDTGQRTALAVDKVYDQREVVIKGLEQNYRQVPGIAAATILGDGRIALIADTDQFTSTGPGTAVAASMGTDLFDDFSDFGV